MALFRINSDTNKEEKIVGDSVNNNTIGITIKENKKEKPTKKSLPKKKAPVKKKAAIPVPESTKAQSEGEAFIVIVTDPSCKFKVEVTTEIYDKLASMYILWFCQSCYNQSGIKTYHFEKANDFHSAFPEYNDDDYAKKKECKVDLYPRIFKFVSGEYRDYIVYFKEFSLLTKSCHGCVVGIDGLKHPPIGIYNRWRLGMSDEKQIAKMLSNFFKVSDLRRLANLIEKHLGEGY